MGNNNEVYKARVVVKEFKQKLGKHYMKLYISIIEVIQLRVTDSLFTTFPLLSNQNPKSIKKSLLLLLSILYLYNNKNKSAE